MAALKTVHEFHLPAAYYFNEDGSHSRRRQHEMSDHMSDQKTACDFCTKFEPTSPTSDAQIKSHDFEHPKRKTRAIRPYPWIHVHGGETDGNAHTAWNGMMMMMFPSTIWPTDKPKVATTKIILGQIVHPVLWEQQITPYFPVPPYLSTNTEARLLVSIDGMVALSQTTTCAELVQYYRQMIKFCLSARYLSSEDVPAWTLGLEGTKILRVIFSYLLEFIESCKILGPSLAQLEAFCGAYTRLIQNPAWELGLTTWDLTMALTDFITCTDCGKFLMSGYTLRRMNYFYQTGSKFLSERVGHGDLLARRKLQIRMSVEYNELIFAADFEREQMRILRRNMRTIASEQGFALQLEVAVLHAKLSEPPIKPDDPSINSCATFVTRLTGLGLLKSAFVSQNSVVEAEEKRPQPKPKPKGIFNNIKSVFVPQSPMVEEKEEVEEKKEQPKRVFSNLRTKMAGMSLFGKKEK